MFFFRLYNLQFLTIALEINWPISSQDNDGFNVISHKSRRSARDVNLPSTSCTSDYNKSLRREGFIPSLIPGWLVDTWIMWSEKVEQWRSSVLHFIILSLSPPTSKQCGTNAPRTTAWHFRSRNRNTTVTKLKRNNTPTRKKNCTKTKSYVCDILRSWQWHENGLWWEKKRFFNCSADIIRQFPRKVEWRLRISKNIFTNSWGLNRVPWRSHALAFYRWTIL